LCRAAGYGPREAAAATGALQWKAASDGECKEGRGWPVRALAYSEPMISRRRTLPVLVAAPAFARTRALRIARFQVDVSPPVGSPLCYSLVVNSERVEAPLLAKGVVLYPEGQRPIVLCAVDWLGIGGESHLAWRAQLSRACGTSPERVAVHTVHQHDAPGADEGAQKILQAHGLGELLSPAAFCREAMARVAAAIRVAKPVTVTEVVAGQAAVENIASNRRIVSPEGKFLFQRFTACRNSPYCAEPDGVIDAQLRTIGFYTGAERYASLHYYATHPMSYYGKGVVNPDFVGMAREGLPGFHVYFTGAAGNIGAGKYNDGDPANRARLAERLRDAMRRSLGTETRSRDLRVGWRSAPVFLPHREGVEFSKEAVLAVFGKKEAALRDKASAGRYLAWHEACAARRPIVLSSLALANAKALHMPAELFVEYQLAAQKEAGGLPVATAAYGDYGPMYIGTARSYAEGGYETSVVSRVAPAVEDILLSADRELLRD
jgi:hypothetical protein